MKKIIVCIIVFWGCINYCKAEEILLFVSATPYKFEERTNELYKRPLIYAYKTSANTLDTVLLLNSEFTNICFLNVYNKHGYLTMLEEPIQNPYFSFINLDNIKYPKKIKLDGGSIESNLIISDKGEKFYIVEIPTIKKILGFDETLYQKVFTAEDYNNTYIQGEVGAPIYNTEFLLLYNEKTNDNALHISKGFGRKIGPFFNMQPPKEMYDAYSSALKSVRVNDNHSMIILYDYSKPQKNKIGEKYFVIYDKMSKEWYQHTFKGNATNVRSYDNGWVAGTVIDMNKGKYFDKTTMQYGDEYDFKRESPGYEERVPIFYERTDGVWGDCFDELIISKGRYYPGLLYLFNVHTKDYIEWDTKQGDSEVLLVQNNNVYYRVNTKILKSAIIDNKRLSEPEMLVDDVRVRDIHWAYLKTSSPKD